MASVDPGLALRVLLVEDDEDDYVLTCALLAEGFDARIELDWVETYALGLGRLTERTYDVAVVDHHLGSGTGIELLRAAVARGCRTPVIMLTGQHDRATDLAAMHAGAADFLVKGRVTGDMLERAIRYARERQRLLDEISALSLTDELTGLSNRRGFLTLADQRLQLLERRGSRCMIAFADVDGLKQANDTLGHEAGDRLLTDAARVLGATFRGTDLKARLGGDEFVVLADDVAEETELMLARLERQIASHNAARVAELGAEAPLLSLSVGALTFQAGPSVSLSRLIAEADALMLQCKAARRPAGQERSTQPWLTAVSG